MEQSLKVSALIALEMIKISTEDSVQVCLLFPQKHFVVMDTSKLSTCYTMISNPLLVPICRMTKEEAELLANDEMRKNASDVIEFYVDQVLPVPVNNTIETLVNHINKIITE